MLPSLLKEDFLHYLWKVKKIHSGHLQTTDGIPVEILDYGYYNADAGPDFLQAKLLLDGTVWVGNVEMHIVGSDWYKHKHHLDPAYENVILHVVYEHDQPVWMEHRQSLLPTIALKGNLPLSYLQAYQSLTQCPDDIPCQSFLHKIPDELIQVWLESLAIQRLHQKMKTVERIFLTANKCWEETAYILIARYFGARVNLDPFEMLARRLPLNLIARNRHATGKIEALVFGQSGMLHASYTDEYFVHLKDEYHFLQKKYNLLPMDPRHWKFSRLHPEGFPTLRLSQFAALLSKDVRLFGEIRDAGGPEEVIELLRTCPSEYWDTHYRFGKESVSKERHTGHGLHTVLIANVCVPLLHYYGIYTGEHRWTMKALSWLEGLPAENNKITRRWKKAGLAPITGLDSQAVIQLYTTYCVPRKCLSCRIGHEIIKP